MSSACWTFCTACITLFLCSLVVAQSVDLVELEAERDCSEQLNALGLQCRQTTRSRFHGRFSTIRLQGTHATGGNRNVLRFQQRWTSALSRDINNEPQIVRSLFVHNDTDRLPSRVRPAESSTYEPISVELSLHAPVLAKRLQKYGSIPFAQYFDTKTAADTFVDDLDPRQIFTDDTQYATFINGTNATCGGEPVRQTDIYDTACSRLFGLGPVHRVFEPENGNRDDPRIRGDNPSTLWPGAKWLDVSSVDEDRECVAAMCYPCPAAGIDRVTLVRSLPTTPQCSVWHTTGDPVLALSGTATLRFNVTDRSGTRSEHVYSIPVDSLRNGVVVDNSLRLSAQLRARLPETLRLPVIDQRHEGVYVTCNHSVQLDKLDMGAVNPYISDTADGPGVTGSAVFDTRGTYDLPFYYMSATRALEYYGGEGACQFSQHNAPARSLYSSPERVENLCAALGADNLVVGGGVPGFAQCAAAGFRSVTPAQIQSELNTWQATYHALSKEGQLAFLQGNRSEFLSPLWDPDRPNIWLHTPHNAAMRRSAYIAQDMWVMFEPRPSVQIPVAWEFDLHVHEALVEVLDPNEPDTLADVPDQRRVQLNSTTSAPVILQLGSGCRYGGLRLEQHGITGVSKDGTRPEQWPDADQFGFSLAVRLCNKRTANATYLVQSNCTSFVNAAVGGERSFVHSERVTISRALDAPVNSATHCYVFTTPYYTASRERLHNYTQNNPDVLAQPHVRLGYCEVQVSDPETGVVYQSTLRNATGATALYFANTNHSFVVDAMDAGHPSRVGFNCMLDTQSKQLASNTEISDEDEEKARARYQFVYWICVLISMVLSILWIVLLCVCIYRQCQRPEEESGTKLKSE